MEAALRNARKLCAVCGAVMQLIVALASEMPRGIARLCATLQQLASARFPQARIVAGVFFLRFLSPGLVTPETYGVGDDSAPVSRAARRNLVLVSRVIQNLANGVGFGEKDAADAPREVLDELNSFLDSQQANMALFCDQLQMRAAGAHGAADVLADADDVGAALAFLSMNVRNQLRHLGVALVGDGVATRRENLTTWVDLLSYLNSAAVQPVTRTSWLPWMSQRPGGGFAAAAAGSSGGGGNITRSSSITSTAVPWSMTSVALPSASSLRSRSNPEFDDPAARVRALFRLQRDPEARSADPADDLSALDELLRGMQADAARRSPE